MDPLPSIDLVNKMSDHDAIHALRVLFEAAPVLEKFLVSIRPWTSYSELIDRSEKFVEQLVKEERIEDVLSILNAHPAIGADPSKLSADSRAEQGKDADPQVLEELARLNKEYEAKFGFRFVVFVNGRPKDVVLLDLKKRIVNTSKREEMQTAAKAMMDIARDRLKKRMNTKL